MRVITFSTKFPANHPRKGQPTYFVEKIWAGLADKTDRIQGSVEMDFNEYYNGIPKWHTIRAGNRWKVGDWFSPRFWSGKPYRSKQALITEPLQIKKVFDFKMDLCGVYSINGKYFMEDNEVAILAKNDGLSVEDMMYWFMPNFNNPKEFRGQILSWSDEIEYS